MGQGCLVGRLYLADTMVRRIGIIALVLLAGLVSGLWNIAWRGLVTPILSVLCLAVLGLLGRVTLTADEEAKDEEVIELGMIHGRKS